MIVSLQENAEDNGKKQKAEFFQKSKLRKNSKITIQI